MATAMMHEHGLSMMHDSPFPQVHARYQPEMGRKITCEGLRKHRNTNECRKIRQENKTVQKVTGNGVKGTRYFFGTKEDTRSEGKWEGEALFFS
jgi:hypothetical protein